MGQRSRSHSTPAYARVAEALRTEIADGTLTAGDRLPSEHQLMATYGVSRTTVRRALAQLATANLVRTHQGRGTFVAPQGLSHGLGDLTSLTQVMLDRGLTPGICCVDVNPDPDPPLDAREFLQSERIWRASRTRTGDHRRFCTQESWLPDELGRQIDPRQLEERQSLYELLRDVADVPPAEATETIRAEAAGTDEAQRLEVPTGSPLIVIYRWTQDRQGRPIEYARSASPGDRYEYVIKLQG